MADKRIVEKNQADWDASSASYLRYNHMEVMLERIRQDPATAFEPAAFAQIRQHFPQLQGVRVCVPSSGDNRAVFALAMLGARVTSCDISQAQLDGAAKAARQLGLDIQFLQADTMTLEGLPDAAFDLVYTSNGVHVWLDDLPAMYRNVCRVLRPGGVYIMCDVHPFQRPFGNQLTVVKPYEWVGPFEDETTVTFTWRVQDFINAMAGAGLRILHMEETHDAKNYDYPFWIPFDEIIAGRRVDPEEVDRMYDWRQNPAMALPSWLCITCEKDA